MVFLTAIQFLQIGNIAPVAHKSFDIVVIDIYNLQVRKLFPNYNAIKAFDLIMRNLDHLQLSYCRQSLGEGSMNFILILRMA
jgi:hypothetical protein